MDAFFYNYPDIITDASNFNLDIYKKYEFNSLKDDTTKPGLLRHQKIVSRFMNGNTDYESLLLYHGLGTGKCVHPESVVCISDTTEIDTMYPITMRDLWEKYESSLIENDIDNPNAYWLTIPVNLYINSINTNANHSCVGKIDKMYKQYIKDEPICTIIFNDQTSLTCTFRHQLYTKHGGFTNIYDVGDIILGKNGFEYQITQIYIHAYTGWVYDLEINTHHSYLVNNIFTHNTCSSIAISEKLHESKAIRKTLVLTRGGALEKQYAEQLVNVCTIPANKYKDPDYAKLNEETNARRSKKLYGKFYEFDSYIKFVKRLQKLRKQAPNTAEYYKKINSVFDGYLFIIDEAHNIRPNFDDKMDIYKELHDLFHHIDSKRILLLSGTPIKDKVYDVAYLMNLLLPNDQQLPTGKAFLQKYIDPETNLFKEESIDELRRYFLGRTSFFRANFESITQIHMGEIVGKLKFLKIDPSYMSEYQTSVYAKALEMDTQLGKKKTGEGGGGSLFSNSRQASLCVDNQGNWGTKINIDSIIQEIRGKKTDLDKIKIIEKYSAKYANILFSVINSPNQNVFIYNTFVKGSGIHVFKKFLEEFGYKRSEGNETKPGLRFAVITNELSNPIKTMRILKLFNSDKNVNGEYIQIIIGSKVANEGLTLKNVRQAHVVAPFWNFTDIEQAIARTIRLNSHQALINTNQPANISIYMHAAIPNQKNKINVDDDDWNFSELEDDLESEDDSDKDDVHSSDAEDSDLEDELENFDKEMTNFNKLEHAESHIQLELENVGKDLQENLYSIDLYMYYTSEQKDIQNKKVERQMKEMAFDCLLNMDNNMIKNGEDGSRECDYTTCVLKCNNQSKLNPDIKIEFDSYDILYDKEYKSGIINCLNNWFMSKTNATIAELQEFCKGKYSDIQFKYTITDMIINAVPIKDKFGIQHFIQYNDENDIHLVYTFNSSDGFYENNYWMQIQNNSIQQFLNKLAASKDITIINKIIETDDENKKWRLVKQLSPTNFDELLKTAVTSTNDTVFKKWVLTKFEPLIVRDTINGDIYLTKNTFNPWKYDASTKKWSVVTISTGSDDINTMNKLLMDKFSPVGTLQYYAIYNDNLNTLTLRSTKDLTIMRKGKGKDCVSFNLLELLKDVILPGKIVIPGNLKPDKKIEQKVNMDFTKKEIDSWTPQELQTVYNVLSMNKEEICYILKDWFEENGKLQIVF